MSELHDILRDTAATLHGVASDTTVLAAVAEMCRFRVRAMVVRNDDVPVGIICEQDVLTRVVLSERDPAKTTVAEIMTQNVVSVDVNASREDVVRVMREHAFHHVPVLEDGEMVGILSSEDVLRWEHRYQSCELRALREYVAGAPESPLR